jgi:Undecaprenyl-phosphate galactose phosphotransferase WbaP
VERSATSPASYSPVGEEVYAARDKLRAPLTSSTVRLDTVALLASDVALGLLVWGAALLVQSVWGDGSLSNVALVGVATNVMVWLGLRALLGLYPGYGMGEVEELRRQSYAVIATLAIMAIFAVAFQVGESLSRLLLLVGILGLLVLAPLVRHTTKAAMNKAGMWGKPVAVIGVEEPGHRLIRTLQQEWKLGFKPVAVFDDRLVPPQTEIEGVPFGGTLDDAIDVAQKHKINTAIFAMPHTRRENLAPLVSRASVCFRHVMIIPNLSGMTNSAVVARDFAGTFGVEIMHNLLDPWTRRIKRALDLCGAVLGSILVSPVVAAIIILIKLDSRGPAFYGHRRLGADNEHFCCWKFRTMHSNAEHLLNKHLQDNPELQAEWELNQKLRNDPRVTRIGRYLRKTSLDELPQLWNVLRGQMSLAGPRPIVDAEVLKYGEVYELYKRIRPGMSGFWQVSGRSDMDYSERVAMDAYYVRNWSVWLDLIILARTVKIVLLGRGAY